MATQSAGFKWYDGFFLSMLAFSIIMIIASWERYDHCSLPLHMWIVVDYSVVFVFRILMFVDNVIASAVGLEYGMVLRGTRFFLRFAVLSVLYLVFYPFLWGWTAIGAIWFASSQDCLPEKNQKWGYIVWLLFSLCGLICLAGSFVKMWLIRRRAHIRRLPQGRRLIESRVLLNMIRQPEVAYQTAVREMRLADQDTAPPNTGMTMSEIHRTAVERAIRRLPIFIIKSVPSDCSDCPICLEEFFVGQAVRGLPCAHNFHMACIDKWIRVNMRCPRCRRIVFPRLNLNPSSSVTVTDDPDCSSMSTTQQSSSSYVVRMQSFLLPVSEESASPSDSSPTSTSTISSNPGADLPCVEKRGEISDSIEESV